uniref:PH domain-containing protein n=1 Tax=Panagrellus redivivus TaxID=6233 RepID=A0A7E4W547_PANRE
MEDNNAPDIVKWLFKEDTTVDLSDDLSMHYQGEYVACQARLKGNLLALKAVEAAVEPILIVCEGLRVEKDEDIAEVFVVKYGDSHQLRLMAADEATRDKWMLKVAVASYQIVRGELDEISQLYLNNSSKPDSTSPRSNTSLYFLTSPFIKDVEFHIKSTASAPMRKITCSEEMYESKLTMIAPLEYTKLAKKWSVELCDLLKSKSWRSNNAIVLEAATNAVRHLNSHIEIYAQAIEFLEKYDGPSFRPSKEKYSLALGPVPTNLHVQFFKIVDKDVTTTCHFVTIGATSAIPLRFPNGGLHRQKLALYSSMDATRLDHSNGVRFATRRRTLLESKKTIGSLTRKIDVDWQVGKFGHVDKIGLEILAEVRQLHGTIVDMISSFPNINNLFNTVYTHEGSDDHQYSLSSQLDALEMSMISLNSKMAVIDTIEDNKEGREHFHQSARVALNSTLDILLQLVEGLLHSQVLGFATSLRIANDCQTYFQIQLREDLILSQTLTVVATGLLATLDQLPPKEIAKWDVLSPLVTYFSFLSCHANEKGMMEDIFDVWSSFPTQVRFKFIPASSTVSQVCIPTIAGVRGDIIVSLPLLPALLEKLGPRLAAGEPFRVRTIFWNLGINHEATLAQSMGSIALEEEINVTAYNETKKYVDELKEKLADVSPIHEIEDQLEELRVAVDENPSRKNVAIFTRVMTLMATLRATCTLGCKSGKDRTSMAVTLEEARFVKEHCGVCSDQLVQVTESLRKNGVRLENCRKNIGKSLYSFSPFQTHFIPKEFRPPAGTYGHNVKS